MTTAAILRLTVTMVIFLGTLHFCQGQRFQAKDGLLIVEVESVEEIGLWSVDTTFRGFLGESYLLFEGSNNYQSPGSSLLSYNFQIEKTGTYRFQWRSRIAKGDSNTDHNDSWLRIKGASSFYAQKSGTVLYPHGSGKTPNPAGSGSHGWFKVYQNKLGDWTWNTSTNDHDPYSIYATFDSTGLYTIEISGRSNGHAIDRFVLYHSDVSPGVALDPLQRESEFVVLTSVEEEESTIKLYPNPVDDLLFFSECKICASADCSFLISNTLGQVVRQPEVDRLTTETGVIALSDLAPGYYFLMILSARGNEQHMFIKL